MKVLLAGICKNIAFNIEILKQGFNKLKTHINCKALFYENNSTDKTSFCLQEWMEKDEDVKCISENISLDFLLNDGLARTWDNLPCRMEIIARARNKLMTYIEDEIYNDIDYVIMIDTDNPVILPVDTIIETLTNPPCDFDALICKGTSGTYIYDTYAYRDMKYPFGPEYLGEAFWDMSHQNNIKHHINEYKDDLIPVYSAFNGMAILRRESILNIRYSAIPTKALDDLYRKYNTITTPKTHIEGKLQGIYLFGTDGIWYQNNSGYNFPIVCEHITFFLEMRKKGFDKIYMYSKLVWQWCR